MEGIKYKPFDLEKAKAGAKVRTRNGRPARIICFDKMSENFPIMALVYVGDGKECDMKFTPRGFANLDEVDSMWDLVMCPERHEGWVNLYQGVETTSIGLTLFKSEEEAKVIGQGRNDYIATCKIEWEE